MIGQCLSNKNESATVAKKKTKFCELNKALGLQFCTEAYRTAVLQLQCYLKVQRTAYLIRVLAIAMHRAYVVLYAYAGSSCSGVAGHGSHTPDESMAAEGCSGAAGGAMHCGSSGHD